MNIIYLLLFLIDKYLKNCYNLLIMKQPTIFNTIPKYPKVLPTEQMATISMSSPFRNVKVAFNWLNTDYPALHEHNHWELFFVVSGTIVHTINNEDYIMKQGDACLIKPLDKHKLCLPSKKVSDYQHINFTFTEEIAKSFLSAHLDFDRLIKQSKPISFTINPMLLNYYCEKLLVIQNLPKADYEKRTKLVLNNIFLLLSEQMLLNDNHYPIWLNEFLEYITSPTTFNKPVEELAKTTPYGYSRLAHLVKEYTGTSIIDFVKNAKMTYAKRLLRTTQLSISEIADSLSYYSVTTFCRTFKNALGLSPLQYRKKHTTQDSQ